jgi:hypothetical protein
MKRLSVVREIIRCLKRRGDTRVAPYKIRVGAHPRVRPRIAPYYLFFIQISLISILFTTPTPPPTPFPLSPTPTPTITHTPTITPTPKPTIDPTIYPAQIDSSAYPNIVLEKLRADGLTLPDGGRPLFTLDNAYALTSDPGFNLITIGKGARSQNFALSVGISWNRINDRSACGVVFRGDLTTGSSSMVLLGVDKTLSIRQYAGNDVPLALQTPLVQPFDPDKFTTLTLIALDDVLVVYIDGKRETAQRMPDPTLKGSFWLTLYNARDNLAQTDCRFRNLWIWTFDPRE